MAKKKNLNLAITIVAAMLVLAAVFFLNQQETIFKVTVGDKSDNLKESVNDLKSQSFFSMDKTGVFVLQSTIPVNAEEPPKNILEMKIYNTYPEYVTLTHVDFYKNGIQAGEKRLDVPLNTGNLFLFQTSDVELSGVPAVKNKLESVFHFTGTSGKTYEQNFIYYYFPLTQCNSNADCSGSTILCDKTNKAGFSPDPLHQWFCTRICNSNPDCPAGQVCKTGVCG